MGWLNEITGWSEKNTDYLDYKMDKALDVLDCKDWNCDAFDKALAFKFPEQAAEILWLKK